MLISIIIPCYNEEKRIGKTLQAVNHFLTKQTYSYEVIVVDNGSDDRTEEIVKEFQKEMPNIRLLRKEKYGKGWAVKEGMLAAEGDYRLFTDADNSTDISQTNDLLEQAKQGYDVVVGSRQIKGAKILHPQSATRSFLGKIFRAVVKMLVPLPVKDTQNGFKLFSKEAAEKIFPKQRSLYWAFDVEILALASKMGFKIKESPILWKNDKQSKMNLKGMTLMLFELLKIKSRLFKKPGNGWWLAFIFGSLFFLYNLSLITV